jgi:hypothetical protein
MSIKVDVTCDGAEKKLKDVLAGVILRSMR